VVVGSCLGVVVVVVVSEVVEVVLVFSVGGLEECVGSFGGDVDVLVGGCESGVDDGITDEIGI